MSIHEINTFILLVSAVHACTCVYVALRGIPRFGHISLILLLGILWPALIFFIFGVFSDSILIALYPTVGIVVPLIAGFAWGGLVRLIRTPIPMIIAALFPALAGLVYFILFHVL